MQPEQEDAGRPESPVPAVGDAAATGPPRPPRNSRRPPVARRWAALASPVLAAVLVGGCAADGGAGASAGTLDSTATSSAPPDPTTSDPGDPSTSDPGDPTTSEPADATDDGTVDDGTGGGTPGGRQPGGGGSDGGTEGLPGWPVESTPVQGAELWAVYLAVGTPGDPVLQQVLDEVQQSWPAAGIGELGCDRGAAEALGRDGTEHAVAVYFATEQHVTEFRRRWGGPYVGAAQVSTYCRD